MDPENLTNLSELLKKAADAGVFLSYEKGGLRFRAVGAFPEALRSEIAANREALIEFLGQRHGEAQAGPKRPPLPDGRTSSPAILSFAQERLWFIDQMGRGSVQYNMPGALRILGRFDEPIAEQALRRIVERHEVLRTVFISGDDGPLQQINPSFDFHLTRIDLSEVNGAAERDRAVAEAMEADALRPFRLSGDLMLRASFLRLGAEEGVLLFNMHHIASDGWSLNILVREFGELYEAIAQGREARLDRLAIQYADYAQWQRNWMRGEALEQQLAYWEKQLAELPQVHNLPLDRMRPALQTFQGSVHRLETDAATMEGIRQLARSSQATVFMVLHGVFSLLLARQGNSADVVMGTPVANRPLKELEPLVGFFVNSLVLRTDCSGERTFRELMEHVRSVNLDAQAHQDVPFEHVVERLNPRRSLSHEPLFQIMFSMKTHQPGETGLQGLKLKSLHADRMLVKSDLMLEAEEEAEKLRLALAYNTDLFTSATIERLGAHLSNLLRAVVANPDENIQALALLGPAEREHLLAGLNPASVDYERDVCIHELFEAWAKKAPDAPALVFEQERLSYRELNQRANRLAHYLRERGVGPDTLVGLCVERSAAMMVGLLGILKAGGAYVPLEPGYPAERLRYMIDDSAPALLLTQTATESRLTGAPSIPTLRLDADAAILNGFSKESPERRQGGLGSDHLAYVIYTSGSTGRPKGVMVAHRNVVNFFRGMDDAVGCGPGNTLLAVTGIAFDISVLELLWTLARGAAVVMAADPFMSLASRTDAENAELRQPPAEGKSLTQLAIECRPSHMQCTPSLMRLIADMPDGLSALRSLKILMLGGEALPLSLAREISSGLRCRLINMYGPTETTIWSATGEFSGDLISVGRPIANTQLYILDPRCEPVPLGVTGELYIAGEGVARGYLGRPDLTAERFVMLPFAGDQRAYRTGDLARYLPDGRVEILGRNDFQIKIRGFRIELGEIEYQIAALPGIHEAVVTIGESAPGQQRLIAYVTLKKDDRRLEGMTSAAMAGVLRRGLQSRLPEYMVPSVFIALEALPLTPNGKVDRKALPAPEGSGSDSESYVAPATETEIVLSHIWAGLLRADARRISAGANFFDLGGHSLLSVRLITQVRASFGVELRIRDVFESPVLSAMAIAVEQCGRAGMPAVRAVARTSNRMPPSFAQERLWFIDQMGGDSVQYNMSGALRIRGTFDEDLAERALRRIVERHEVLRTVFVSDDQGPAQQIDPLADFRLTRVDLRAAAGAEARERAVREAMRADAFKPFRLNADPMLRASLLHLGAEEGVLLFSMHHIASDAWSVGILIREFSLLYAAAVEGGENPLPPLPIQYADYSQWQRAWMKGDVLEEQLGYWKKQLSGAPPVHGLPLDHVRPAKQRYEGVTHRQQFDGALLEKLKEVCRREQVTLFMLLETVFALLVARYSQEGDVVIGTPVAGRMQEEVEGLIGFFVNNLALRSRFASGQTFRGALAEQKQMILGAYGHQQVAFEMLVETLNPERSLSHDPIFQIVFSLNNTGTEGLELPGLKVETIAPEKVPAKVDLEVVAAENDGGMSVGWIYRTDLFGAASLKGMAESYEKLLHGIAANAERGIFEYEMAEEVLFAQLLRQGRGARAAYPETCVHEQIEEQARKHPEAPAVICGEKRLSYAQLDEKAERLARYLRQAGVGLESRVGIYLGRSAEMLIGVLGVMKSGGAYVALDPGQPRERVKYLVQDAGIEWVLVESQRMEELPLKGVDVVVMDGAGTDAEWMNDKNTGEEAQKKEKPGRDNLAYILYTSGSTGRPKGVMVKHRGLSNYVGHAVSRYMTEEIAGGVVSSPLGFDATVTSLLAPLAAGRIVELLEDDEHTLERLADRMFAETPAWLFKITPAHLEALEYLERKEKAGRGAHRIVIGGEQLGAQRLRKWKEELLPRANFVNEYGPTEAVVGCSVWELKDVAKLNGQAAAPIGRPIANTQLYVVGEGGGLQPVNGVGELYIGGEGVARGYWKRDELTRDRFVAAGQMSWMEAENAKDAGSLYRTGDLVRWLHSGDLQFVGRRDDQVKVRGYRIEPGEIEAVLREHAEVEQAAVAVREGDGSERRLVAYVVAAAKDKAPDMGGLKSYLQQRLPAYMVPAAFVLLDDLPLSANGKVDRRALPAPDGEDISGGVYVEPRNAVERAMCDVWQEVLKRDRVGVRDNFFSLGGDSILSIRVVSQLRLRGIGLKVRDIFQHQTVEHLAAQAGVSAPVATAPALQAFGLLTDEEKSGLTEAYEDAYPMSALQAGMVFHTQLEKFSGIYHDIMAEHVRCPWDRERFGQALAACIEEYPVLRTGFRLDGARPLQHVHRRIEPPLEVEDLRDRSAEEQDRCLAEWMEERRRHVFDWERGPLFQVSIFRRTDESFEFALSFHHAVFDGWSRAAFTTLLYNRYERLLQGEPSEPVRVDRTYREFIAQEQQVLGNKAAKAYFAALLEDAPIQQLPRTIAAGAGYSQGNIVVEPFRAISGMVIDLAHQMGVPVQTILQAAHFKVLSVMSGQSRVVSCVTQNGRPETQGAERSLGLFLNSLPMSVEMGAETWRELIGKVDSLATAGMEYRGYPLSQIQQDLDWMFSEVLFNYTHYHIFNEMTGPSSGDRLVQSLRSRSFELTNFDFAVDFTREFDEYSMGLKLIYDCQVLDGDLVTRMGQYYINAFTQMLACLDDSHCSRSLLTAEEEHQVVTEWNSTAVQYEDRALCMHQLFEAQADKTPGDTAVVHAGQKLSYEELEWKANQLGNYLRKLGVGPEDRVGICVGRGPVMVAGLFGILKSGGAYVPLDPTYPAERLAFMMQDARIGVLLTESNLLGRLPRIDAKNTTVVCVDTQWHEIALESGERSGGSVGPDNLAYIYYTSGSTGRPKGVAMAHSGIANYILWGIGGYGAAEGNGAAVHSSIAVDLTLTNFLPLFAGRSVVLAEETPGVEGLAALMKRHPGWGMLKLTPTHLALLNLELDGQEKAGSTRVLVIGADNLVADPTLPWREQAPGVKLLNEYGPTETVVGCSIYHIDDHAPRSGSMPIGRPIANITMYILDRNRHPMPAGVSGELCIGGIGVARGYWGRPDLTAEKFVPDPFAATPGTRLYCTGDRARFLPDGNLEFLGRLDHQVKIRGYRIEPGEVEAVLSGFPGVQKAMVVVNGDIPGEKRLIAYVADPEKKLRAGDLRQYLKDRLPEYMVPAIFMILEALPVRASGKIDPKDLPKPEMGLVRDEYTAPSTPVEIALAQVWADILKVETGALSANANFFDLGGHSLAAMRMIARVVSMFGAKVELRDVFAAPELADFARRVSRADSTAITRIGSAGRGGNLPVSFAQQRLWIVDRIDGGSSQYNLPVALRLKGALDRSAVREALGVLVDRHEVLRTTYVEIDGAPHQVVREGRGVEVEEVSLRDLGRPEQEEQVARLAEEEVIRPFALERDLMLRVKLMELGEQEHVVLFTQHHIASDAWSMEILVREFSLLYTAAVRGQENPLAPLPIQYADYAQWQREWMKGEVLEEQLGYWKKQLSGAPLVHGLPLDYVRPAKQGHAGATHWQHLDRELTEALKEVCRREQVTLFMLLETIFALLAARYSGEQDVVIGTPVAGRLHEEVEGLIGFFVNNLALRSRFEDRTFRSVLAEQKQMILGAYGHQQVAFEMLVEALNPERNLGHDPIFQLVFSFINTGEERLELPGLNVESVSQAKVLAKVDLEVVAAERGGALSVGWTYRTDLFAGASMKSMAESYERLLRGIAAGAERAIFEYPLVGEEEAQQLLEQGRGARAAYSKKSVHEQIAAQAESQPDATAVVCGHKRLSYRELNEKAERLARYLREGGVGLESRVGIYLSRSPEMLIGLLGVMKAGGAYVALEPGQPKERVKYLVEDAGIEWVLVESERMEDLPLKGVDVVVMDGAVTDAGWMEDVAGGEEQKKEKVRGENLAYVLYTSGSTGRPKGVLVKHRGLSNYIGHAVSRYMTGEIKGGVVSSPLSFDATVTSLLAPLAAGRVVELLEDDEQMLERLAERMFSGDQAWLFKVTPAHLEALEHVKRNAKTGNAAHRIVIGGEQLDAERLRKWKEQVLPRASFVNEYGPTETVVGCSVWELSDEKGIKSLEGLSAAPIGRPIGNTELYVAGRGGQLQPVNSVGELYIGGEGVARGYRNQEELTREKFVDAGHMVWMNGSTGSAEVRRLYRTGDMVRWLRSGELQFVGRCDDQVKLRGYRIEPGEIEAVLRAHQEVAQAVVVVRETEAGEKRLVAYVVGANDRAPDVGSLRSYAQEMLPGYMVPSAFVLIHELPLTANGKVDRKALPAPEGADAGSAYAEPGNEIERALCEVWQQVLRQKRVGVRDNFFSLGGDSILSIRVVAQLRDRGIELKVRDIFRYQTVEQLAAQAVLSGPAAELRVLPPFALLTAEERSSLTEDYEDAYPMSALQAGMVFHTQLEQFSGIYHDIMADHVQCPWNEDAFGQALATCIAQHPVLRTGFRLDGPRPLQHVHARIDLPLEVADLRELQREDQDSYLAQWMEERTRHVFDWERGPLFQVNIFLRTDESFEFVLSFHHAVLDGWSRAAFTTQLYNRYERLLRGEQPEPVRTDRTYRDFIAQEQQVLENGGAKAYFSALLEDAPLEQLPRLKTETHRDDQAHIVLKVEAFPPLSARLVDLAQQMGVPMQSVLLAGHFKALSAVSGRMRALSCVTHSGRPETDGSEQSLGLYLNSLPMVMEVRPGTWRELIARIAQAGAAGMEYRGYPLSKIQQDVGADLGEVTFNYTHFHIYRSLANSADHKVAVLNSYWFEQSNFDFHVNIVRSVEENSLRMEFIYDGQIFSERLMERMTHYYVRAFAHMLENPDGPHHARTLLTPEEVEELLSWNETAVSWPDQCLHDQIEERARRHPEAPAVLCGDTRLTFGELSEKSERLARYLRQAGVELESRVGIYLSRSPEMLIGLLGVMKSGGAYVALEPGLPRERVKYMVEDAGIEWVLVESERMEELPLKGVDVVVMDGAAVDAGWMDAGWMEEAAEEDGAAKAKVSGENLAYILYTSGSTGKPKGVMVKHHGLSNYIGHAVSRYMTEEIEGGVVSSPLSFDATVTSLLAPLAAGRMVELLKDDERLLECLAERMFDGDRAWLFKVTPAHLEALEYVEKKEPIGRAAHRIVIGGEQLGAARLRKWKEELLPLASFVNEYGPTETVVGCSVWELKDEKGMEELAGLSAAPIGRPIGNTQLYVVGEAGDLQPVNSVGELYIGGAGVARGYWNQDELTRQRFADARDMRWIRNAKEGSRLYRTGDLVRRLESGELQFVGRRDDQVKVRGYRIELGEIEGALRQFPEVEQAVVVAREGEGGEKQLVAYVVAVAKDGGLDTGTLRSHLQERLPGYMVPSAFVTLDALPLTPNGKVDRRALPAPEGAAIGSAYAEPRNEVERVLCEIWQEVLNRAPIGIHDNFFSLGGDSILSIQMVSRANRAGVAVNVRQMFNHPTVAELASRIEQTVERTRPRGEVEGAMPLLPIQQEFLNSDALYYDHYNQSMLLVTPKEFGFAALQPMIEALYRRHDALRLRFAFVEGAWEAQHAPLTPEMTVESCVREELPESEEQRAAFIAERCSHYQRSLNIESGPLLRAVYMHGAEEGRLLLVIHHLIVDGVSWRIILADLEQAWAQICAGGAPEPMPGSSSYQQWSEALTAYAASPALEREREYWHEVWDKETPAWPVEPASAEPAPYATTRSVTLQFSAAETDALLTECSGKYRTEINELLLAAVYQGMREWSGARNLRITLEGHGREELFGELDTTETVGWFTTMYPLVLGVDSGEIRQVIKAVKEEYRRVPHHGIGYGLLRYKAGDELLMAAEAVAPPPLLFNYFGQLDRKTAAGSAFAVAPESAGETVDPRRARSHPLGLNGMVIGGILRFRLDYSEQQYDEQTMAALARSIEDGLRLVIAHCLTPGRGDYTPADFPLATVDQALLDQWQRYDIQSLYPSTGMQRGMLFHGLLDSEAYISQVYPVLNGRLDLPLLAEAWRRVVNRHSVFRTIFVGEGEYQHQLVLPRASLVCNQEDWRKLPAPEQQLKFEQYRLAEKARGFDVSVAPLMRLSLFRLADDRTRMLWSYHHSLLDGWSVPLVYRDVMLIYAELAQGRPADLAPAHEYERYMKWLMAQDREEARAWWKSYLEPVETVTPLPFDRLEGNAEVLHESQDVSLAAADLEELKALARKHQTTVNTLVQLAWGTLLHRYSGESRVTFGAVVSGRSAPVDDVESMVGLFINTIPVVIDFAGDRLLADLITDLHSAFQRSQSHGHLPLTEIQKQSGFSRGESLFRSLVVFENYPLDSAMNMAADRSAIAIESVETDIEDTYPLALGVFQGETLGVSCNYFGHLFTPEAITRLLNQLMYVLRQMPRSRKTADIALLTPAEVEQMLLRNQTAAAYPQTCVHEQIEDQARRQPEAIAVVFGKKRLSYGELNEKAERLASYLRQGGVGLESRVGIYLGRSPEMLIGLLGVMKSGGAYVALEPGLPRERVKYMVEDAGIEWVLVESQSMEELPLKGVDVVVMDGAGTDPGWMQEEEGGGEPTRESVGDENLAYILYTSGSTGRPKGVMVKHRGLRNYVGHAVSRYMTPEIAGGVVSSPLSFDATVTSLLAPLAAGRIVELLNDDERTLEELAARMFEGVEAWLFKVTPAHLEALEYAERKEQVGRAPHRVVIGGEQLSAARLRRWKEKLLPHATFVNEYGPTETVVGCSAWELKDDKGLEELAGLTAAPIGRPIGNTELYVVGEGAELQPVNGVGELYIGGAGVARGYWKQEELTRERFVEAGQMAWIRDAKPGELLYRTGDLVKWLASGELQFVGRRDDQVKVRGYRIELGEIEGTLRIHDEVAQAVVLAREGEDGEKRLVAYVVPKERGLTAENLRSYMRERLPEYMTPSAFVLLDELPLTVNGKVDRRALPAPEAAEIGSVYVEPRNEVERILCEVWRDVLKRDRVGVRDSFFSLGGDSILSIRVVSQLKSQGIVLSIKDIFRYHTVERLAEQIHAGSGDQEGSVFAGQIAQLAIRDRDKPGENVIETIL